MFQVDAGVTASISGLTITGGMTTDNGGGLANNGGNVTLTNCTISSNSAAGNGGGLDSNGGRHADADRLHNHRQLRRATRRRLVRRFL